jgi:DNA mismatch repair ATPase MutS
MRLDSITLADLEVFRDPGGRGGVAALFAQTETSAGRAALHRRLRTPSADLDEILHAQAAVRFFAEEWKLALLPQGLLDTIERYLASNIDLGGRHSLGRDLTHSVWLPLRDRDLCRELTDGVSACSDLLSASERLARALLAADPPPLVRSLAEEILTLRNALGWVRRTPFLFSTIRTDRALRTEALERMRDLVALLAELDALRTMGVTTGRLGWALPELVDAERFLLEADGLYHPFLDAPTGNPVEIAGGEPVVFLTGPNMAGKTTYMRALGLATLLAQVGMGVPATRMRLTPVEVLLTGLNPSDNLRAGLSFFFAEVMRVREAAEHLAGGRRCLVLFDEVFKGTNVKDALEASLAVISGFAKSRESGCVFSSHLVELADPLSGLGRVRFFHFEGDVVDGRATYSYRLRPGVSDQRFGLQLLEEARVPELLAQIGL